MAKKSAKSHEITLRSSAAEYLTFVSAIGDQPESVELRYQDENIWLTQRLMAELYGVEVPTINEHIQKIYADHELDEEATIRNFRIVQTEGTRQVSREVKHYSLQMIIAVGFKVNNERAVQFRKWANAVVKDYTIQGWVMDSERLKKGGTILTKDYFEKQLEKVREIRLSERRFYQKVTDIYATSIDYDPTAAATQRFFAAVQNKLHYAVHQHTAAELIYERADADKENMGLTTWEGAPEGKIHRYDVSIAKNYLTHNELQILARIVNAYLDFAEMQAMRQIPMTMADWETRLNGFLTLWDRKILQDAGRITAELAKAKAETEFEKYRIVQDRLYQSDFDHFLQLETEIDNSK
ncbi:MAG: virulence RhuM family protein [Paludibacteraceae bacterium]|nr:virulence RhuM family protein [Paludibacteraceae bacterium]